MAPPEYNSIKKEEIEEIPIEGGILRLISGRYKDHQGFRGKYLPLDYYHIYLEKGGKLSLENQEDDSVMIFTLLGDAKVAGELVKEKTAVKLTEGRELDIEALDDIQLLFISSKRLDEPVAWGGPIVMNTDEELRQAFADLRNNTFLKEGIHY